MSVFLTTNHLLLRDPRGGVEDVAAMKAAGFGSVFCNIGDHPPSNWGTVRDRARAAGVACGPWLRTATTDNRFDYDRFHTLLTVADQWGSPLIVNSESEIQGTGGEITSYIEEQLGPRDAAISVETWPFDNVHWYHLENRPVLPQLFKSIVSYEEQPTRDIWHGYGINCVVLTFGSYGGSVPGDYDRLAPFGIFTADDCAQRYSDWKAIGTCTPCNTAPTPTPPDGGDNMTIPTPKPGETIGTEHGITALIDWLQAQPGMPKRGSGYNPAKPGTWPWPERVERTLRILAADHDAV